jgi:hypothetical protein
MYQMTRKGTKFLAWGRTSYRCKGFGKASIDRDYVGFAACYNGSRNIHTSRAQDLLPSIEHEGRTTSKMGLRLRSRPHLRNATH